eukprot:gene30060-35029_t
MSLFGLGAYDSDSSDSEAGSEEGAPPPTSSKPEQAEADDSDSYSDSESVDSAAERVAAAEARLKYFGNKSPTGLMSKSLLPSPLDILNEVDGPPGFLDPEATRQLVQGRAHTHEQAAPSATAGATKVKQKPGPGFDISKLAPPPKGSKPKSSIDKRELPTGALIEGKAKRYKTEEDDAGQLYTASQIAMLGGNVKGPVADATGAAGAAHAWGPSTKAMDVSSFLDKGVGAAQLPRRAQDRKDKEKDKRSK